MLDPISLLIFGPIIVGLGSKALKAMRGEADKRAKAELARQRVADEGLQKVVVMDRRFVSRGVDQLEVARAIIRDSSVPGAVKQAILAGCARQLVEDQECSRRVYVDG